jgi:DNA repair exonuclease SbcCD ATPase subunit
MSAAVFISLLLLGTPVQSAQDSVSAQRVERLESRITELEKQVLEYRAREDYFQSILASQRWTFGTVVGLFAALVGLVGFGVFKRYVSEVEDVKSEMENRMKEELGQLHNSLEDAERRVESLDERVEEYEDELRGTEEELAESIEETRNDCIEHTSLSIADLETDIQVLRAAIKELADEVEE